MWALMRFVPAMDLPVPVQAARVGELLSTNLAGNCRLPIGANLTGSGGKFGQKRISGFLLLFLANFSFMFLKNETGLTYIEHNVSCVGNKKTTFRKDNGYTDIMIVKRIHLKTSIKASPRP